MLGRVNDPPHPNPSQATFYFPLMKAGWLASPHTSRLQPTHEVSFVQQAQQQHCWRLMPSRCSARWQRCVIVLFRETHISGCLALAGCCARVEVPSARGLAADVSAGAVADTPGAVTVGGRNASALLPCALCRVWAPIQRRWVFLQNTPETVEDKLIYPVHGTLCGSSASLKHRKMYRLEKRKGLCHQQSTSFHMKLPLCVEQQSRRCRANPQKTPR